MNLVLVTGVCPRSSAPRIPDRMQLNSLRDITLLVRVSPVGHCNDYQERAINAATALSHLSAAQPVAQRLLPQRSGDIAVWSCASAWSVSVAGAGVGLASSATVVPGVAVEALAGVADPRLADHAQHNPAEQDDHDGATDERGVRRHSRGGHDPARHPRRVAVAVRRRERATERRPDGPTD